MASVQNAFSLLAGGDGQLAVPSAGGSKAKKKGKKKGSQAGATANGSEAATITPAPEAPVSEPVKTQTAKEAVQSLEASAVAAGPGEFGALAQQWTDQVHYNDTLYADGSQLADFKQVLLKSKALELLLEGCLERGATAADAPALAALLATVAHPAAPAPFTEALAAAVTSLGQVCAADRLAPTPAAKRSVAAALALVRRGVPKPPPARPAEAPAAKFRRLGGELSRQEARLAGTTQPKELSKAFGSILELLCGQLDVLRPAGGEAGPPLAPEVAAALKLLEDLRAALAHRLQEVQAPPKPRLSVPEQLAEAEASHRKEDAALAGRLSEVEGRIASLEAELAALKREAGELRSRRSAAQEHHAHRLEAIRSGKPASGASAAEVASAVQRGLGALDGLGCAMRGGSEAPAAAAQGDAEGLAKQVVDAEVPVKLGGAVQQVVELSLGQLHELGAKARFFRERLDKAIKQGEQAAKLGLGDPKLLKQQRSTAENNVRDVLAAAEAAAGAARGAVAAYRERLPVILRLPSFLPPPPEYLSALDTKAAEAAALLDSILNNTYVPQAAAQPAAGAAPANAPAAAVAPAAPAQAEAPAPRPASAAGDAKAAANGGDVRSLEARLAALEAENAKKDAKIAAMVSSATLEVPSPLAARANTPPARLPSPVDDKPASPAAPQAASADTDAASAPAADAAEAETEAAPAPKSAAGGAPVVTFSQALLSAPQQANGKKGGHRPRRA